MATKNHSEVVKGSRHAPHNLEYTTATNRENGTNEASGIVLTSDHLYMVARQTDDDTFWILLGIGPPLVWARLIEAEVVTTIGGEDLQISVQNGGWCKYHAGPLTLADDAEFSLPGCGFGTFLAGNDVAPTNHECLHVSWDSNGTVYDLGSTTNTAITDSDTDWCCYDSGSVAKVKNRLGGSRYVIFEINFYNPIVV
jgi:hypothetical protein